MVGLAGGGPPPGAPPPGPMHAQGTAPPAGPPGAPPGAPPQDDRRATPEEKQLAAEFYGNVSDAIYEPKTAESIAKALQGVSKAQGAGVSAVEPVAQAVAQAVSQVSMSALQEGVPITKEIVVGAIGILAADVGTNLAKAAGVPPLDREQIHAVFLRVNEIALDQREQMVEAQKVLDSAPPPEVGAPPEGGAPPGPPQGTGLAAPGAPPPGPTPQ